MRLTTTSVDEEASPGHLSANERKRLGAFYTPSAVVERALTAVAPFVPRRGVTVIDPACGTGAFLSGAARQFESAALRGLELHPRSAALCRARVPAAQIGVGDALIGDALERLLPSKGFELWVGNPPYNGTSSVLGKPKAYARLKRLFPAALPVGQSLREDFVFFLLRAAERLTRRPGALVFVTSSTLLDAYLYAPVRQALLERLSLREVIDLGPGVFAAARVSTCITVWTSPRRSNSGRPRFGSRHLAPEAPEWRLRPVDGQAEALHRRWLKAGQPLGTLVPVSLPGLKTRFDELLVDDDRGRLTARLTALFATRLSGLSAFCRQWDIPQRCFEKLVALKRGQPPDQRLHLDRVRRFHRHRGPPGWCYLDRALIPRGDHRLQGEWDPHQCDARLVFTVRELPLWARLLRAPGCVTAYRHSRFAPLMVPEAVRAGGPAAARRGGALGPMVPNLSPEALELGDPLGTFEAIARFISSAPVQNSWAPAFATTRQLPVPWDALRPR